MSGAVDSMRMARTPSPGIVSVWVRIPIGAAGATGTLVGRGVVSVAKNTTGVYDVVLDRGYAGLVMFDGTCMAAAGALNHPTLKTTYVAGTTALQFQTCIQAGTATEPASGDAIMIIMVFNEGDLL